MNGQTGMQLRDVAGIRKTEAEKTSFFYCIQAGEDGREGIRLLLRRSSGFSPRTMSANVKKELDEIRRSFGKELEIVLLSDRSEVLEASLQNLLLSLFLGASAAFIILLIFMKNMKQSVILLFTLPSSLLWPLLFLFLTGKSLNLMSLGGLAVGAGMVVDNSIIMTERLSRRLRASDDRRTRLDAIEKEAAALAPAVTGATLTTAIVFMPLLLVKGLAGSLLSDLGLSVILSMLSSALLSLSAVPVLYLLLNPSPGGKSKPLFTRLRKLVAFGLRRPGASALIAAGLCLAGFAAAVCLPAEIIPPPRENSLRGTIHLPCGTSIDASASLAEAVSGEIALIPGIEAVFCWAGGEKDDIHYLASTDESRENIQFGLILSKNSHPGSILKAIANRISIPDCRLTMSPRENVIEDLLALESGEEWIVRGETASGARAAAEELRRIITESGREKEPPAVLTRMRQDHSETLSGQGEN